MEKVEELGSPSEKKSAALKRTWKRVRHWPLYKLQSIIRPGMTDSALPIVPPQMDIAYD